MTFVKGETFVKAGTDDRFLVIAVHPPHGRRGEAATLLHEATSTAVYVTAEHAGKEGLVAVS